MSASAIAIAIASDVRPSTARHASLVIVLRELFEDIASLDLSAVGSGASFMEIGLDSLTLTQAAIEFKKQFKVSLTFRQLMETYRSLDALAEYLDVTLPPDPAVSTPPLVVPLPAPPEIGPRPLQVAAATSSVRPPAVVPAGTPSRSASAVHQVIAQQLQLMRQQLALLSAMPSAEVSSSQPSKTSSTTPP